MKTCPLTCWSTAAGTKTAENVPAAVLEHRDGSEIT